jgi:septal ring factor EnvC (AmiA/AmiB activator)
MEDVVMEAREKIEGLYGQLNKVKNNLENANTAKRKAEEELQKTVKDARKAVESHKEVMEGLKAELEEAEEDQTLAVEHGFEKKRAQVECL